MKIRLSFAEINDPDLEFWTSRLRSFGLEVTAARLSGIEAEGSPENIEKALKTKILTVQGSPPQLQKIGIREEGKKAPLAYFPRTPTFFP